MEEINRLTQEIIQLTTEIETNYPELYHFLEENPATIPNEFDPDIGVESLRDYLQTLKELLRQHQESHLEHGG